MQTKTKTQGRGAKSRRAAWRSPLVIALGALLVLQLLVALALGLGEKDRGPTASAGPLLAFAPEQVTGIRIRSPEKEPISVTKTPDGWTIPSLADLPAAEHKVTGLLAKLAGLQKGVPVATSEEALKRFKVAADAFERKLVLERGDDSPAILYLGDSPGFRRLFVRAAEDGAIYEAELGLFDAPDQPGSWSDRTLLHLDPKDLQRLTVAGLSLERTDDAWRLADLAAGEKQNQQAIKNKVRALTNLDFLDVLIGAEKPALDPQATPIELEATLAEGKTIRYRISKLAEGDDHLLQASNRPQDFRLAGYAVEALTNLRRADLLKTPEEDKETIQNAEPTAEAMTTPPTPTQDAGETIAPDP
ncbi:MAG: DUF4340 domain-containing protein [Candidatus Thiosymbion ectosymbiont of Robbea hypermnestra]|nr:DUF4340 domain-containing protein [Candidatus Thiosymbion ectosymbiont of Robbea hypermnestra]